MSETGSDSIRVRNFRLFAFAEETYVGKTGLVTGWGTLKEDGKPSCILQEVDVPILSNDDCTSKTNYTSKMITSNMMCAGYPGVGQRDRLEKSLFLAGEVC